MHGGRHLEEAPAPMSASGWPKYVPGMTFYLRYNRNRWEPVGKDPDTAIAAKRRREFRKHHQRPLICSLLFTKRSAEPPLWL